MLLHIPSGVFRMGSRFHAREYPPRLMQVSEFQIAQAPVLVGQYEAFIQNKAVGDKTWWSEEGWDWLKGNSDGWGRKNRNIPDGWEAQMRKSFHPVTGITVYEAEAYCAWLSATKSRTIRLPTEVEWEYAARGDDARPFPWGEEFHATFANTAESERFSTMEVANMPNDISPFGVMGMCGNIQEWTSSIYVPAPKEVTAPGPLRVARGGSFHDTYFGSRTSYRRAYPAEFFYPFLGFRIIAEIV